MINLSKKDKEQEPDDWWPRITKEKVKNQFITIDWSKWIDPDASDDDGKANQGLGDMDPSQMQDFSMGGAMGDDSDDEEEESHVEPYVPEENLDDLDAEETQDLKKSPIKWI